MNVSLEQRNLNHLNNLLITLSDMNDGTAASDSYIIPLEGGHFLLDGSQGERVTIEFVPTPAG